MSSDEIMKAVEVIEIRGDSSWDDEFSSHRVLIILILWF